WNAICVFVVSRLVKAMIVHAHGVSAGAAAIWARRVIRKLRVVCDFHGGALEEYLARCKFSRVAARRAQWIGALERLCWTESDGVITVSERLMDYLRKRAGERRRVYAVVPCASDVPELDYEQRQRVRREMDLTGKYVFAYAGSYRHYQRIGRMLDVFSRVLHRRQDAFLLIMTNQIEEFERELVEHKTPRDCVRIMSLPRAEVPFVLQVADSGFLLRDHSPLNQLSSPTKFAEYLAAGVPVICEGDIGDYGEILKENKVGMFLEEIDSLESVLRFMRDVERDRMGFWLRCRQMCEARLSWERVQEELYRLYVDLLG
ncbi:MAG: glycosyltransferase, partial [Armatimonadota bacterium]